MFRCIKQGEDGYVVKGIFRCIKGRSFIWKSSKE